MEVLRQAGVSQGEIDHWGRWLQAAEEISAKFEVWEDDPFGYNEQASVGILAAAAFQAGLVALPEYVAQKASKEDGRKRRHGRCDLWLAAARSDWAFEFKHMIRGSVPRLATLRTRLDDAVADAKEILTVEAKRRVACLIVSTYPTLEMKTGPQLRSRLRAFAKEVDFAVFIEPQNRHARPVYFFMQHHR